MSDQKPFIPFEGNAIRRALGEPAATGPGYVHRGQIVLHRIHLMAIYGEQTVIWFVLARESVQDKLAHYWD